MKEYNFFFNLNSGYFTQLKNLLLSLKLFKKKDAIYNCIVYFDEDNIEQYKLKLHFLESEDFKLQIGSSKKFKNNVKPLTRNYVYCLKCIIPQICYKLDKVLYMDCDILITKEGIEDFYDSDLTDYYLATCWDPINNLPVPGEQQKRNCRTNYFFNSGVVLYNIKKIIQEGKEYQMSSLAINWLEILATPFPDQTFLNYVFNDKVLECSLIYNNILYLAYRQDAFIFTNKYRDFGYQNPIDSLKDTVVLHFAGLYKIWNDLTQEQKKTIYYYNDIKDLYEKSMKKILDFELFLLSKE